MIIVFHLCFAQQINTADVVFGYAQEAFALLSKDTEVFAIACAGAAMLCCCCGVCLCGHCCKKRSKVYSVGTRDKRPKKNQITFDPEGSGAQLNGVEVYY